MSALDDIKIMNAPIPEDVERLKSAGFLNRALQLIDIKLQDAPSDVMRRRLLLEKRVIETLPYDYTLERSDAIAAARSVWHDLSEAQFDSLRDKGRLDWIFIEGKEMYYSSTAAAVQRAYGEYLNPMNEESIQHDMSLASQSQIAPIKGDCRSEAVFEMLQDAHEPLAYRLTVEATIRVKDAHFTPEAYRIHMPIPARSKRIDTVRNIEILSHSDSMMNIDDEYSPSRTIYFEKYLSENETFLVRYAYDSVHKVVMPDLSEYSISPLDTDIFASYLCEQPPHIIFTPFLRELAAEIKGDEVRPLFIARRIYDYITTKLSYSYVREYFNIKQIPEYLASRGMGDCGVQELLFITLCRICGIPAVWQSGLTVKPDYAGPHDWGMFYVEPYGWMHNDCSVGGGYIHQNRPVEWNFFFSNIDPYRMIANNELQTEFNPLKKHLRIDPYDNQAGEIETASRGLTSSEVEYTRRTISCERIKV